MNGTGDFVQGLLTALLGTGGLSGLVVLGNAIVKWRSGRAARETQRNASAVNQMADAVARAEKAEDQRDAADARRRKVQEYAARLRRQLIEIGIDPGHDPSDDTTTKKE